MRGFLSLAYSSLLAFSFIAQAHVPPLSQEERDGAPLIIEGRVLSRLETYAQRSEGFGDYLYVVTIEVSKSNKEAYLPGSHYGFTYWRAADRPEGICGDMGQDEDARAGLLMRAGKNVRLYALEDKSLLSPNGFDVIKEEPVELRGALD